jgi:hypothetical protein
MNLSSRYEIDLEVSSQRLKDATVIVHLATGKIHHTNETGSRIWELVEQGRSGAEILDTLESEFDAPRDQLERELEGFLEQLVAQKMIRERGQRK